MRDTIKTRKQLIDELAVLRRKLAEPDRRRAPADMLQRAALKPAAPFAVYENLPAFVCVQEADYTISYANRKFRELFGNPGRKHCYELIWKRKSPCKPCAPFKAFTTNRQVVWEWNSPSGETYEVHDLPFTDAGGTKKILGVGFDITDRKRAEAEQALLRFCFDNVPDSMAVFSSDGRIIYINAANSRNLGYTSAELTGKRLVDLNIKAPPHAWRKYWAEVRRRGSMAHESVHVRKDGTSFPVEVVSAHIAHNGQEYLFAHAKNISQRKRAEMALRESEERYRKIFEGAAEGILVCEIATMRFKYANPAICSMLGYAERELIGKRVSDIHPRSQLKHVLAEFSAIAHERKERATDIPCRRKDGSLIYADITGTNMLFDGAPCNLGFFTDITERKRIQEQLYQNEELLRLTFEKAPVAAVVLNKKWRVVNVNEYCERILGHTAAEIRKQGIDAYLHPEDKGKSLHSLMASPEKLKEPVEFEIRYVAGDGHTVYARQQVQGVFDRRGQLILIIVLIEDITERKQHEYIKTNILSRMSNLYRDLQELSETLPAEQSFSHTASMRDFSLSPMENRVASMLSTGYPNKQIAASLNISENTVKHHLTSIYSKCKVTNRLEFLRFIREKRIIL